MIQIWTAKVILHEMGVEVTDTNVEQLRHMFRAFGKFLESNAHYKDLWMSDNPYQHAQQIRHKGLRVGNIPSGIDWALSEVPKYEDDVIDLINYSVFFLRSLGMARVTNEDIERMGCELRERRWPGNSWACNYDGDDECPVHGGSSNA